jgi:hypothetical protein
MSIIKGCCQSTRKSCVFSLIIALSVFLGSACLAGETPQYVGVKKCQACHSDQFTIWVKGPHAKAWGLLDPSDLNHQKDQKKAAKALKVTGDYQKAAACLQCHVTGYGKPGDHFAKSYDRTEGVTCEACHGPGSLYLKAMARDEEKYATDPKTTAAEWAKLGLVKPNQALCKTCHKYDEKFSFAEKFKKIAHPR